MKNRWYRVLAAALAIAGGCAWWIMNRPEQAEVPDPGASVAAVQRRTLVATVAATGKVTARVGAEVRVGSRISGRVQRLYANIGDLVRVGQVIAELGNNDQQALLDQHRAE